MHQLPYSVMAQAKIDTFYQNIRNNQNNQIFRVFTNEGNMLSESDMIHYQNSFNSFQNSSTPNIFCTAGYFRVYFEDVLLHTNDGFDSSNTTIAAARRNLVCQVFSDLSQLIQPANNPYTGASTVPFVNIIVERSALSKNGVLAYCKPFDLVPPYKVKGTIDNKVWKTINGGMDSYYALQQLGITKVPMFHAAIQCNFGYNFYTTLNALPSSNTQRDLYAILLHEISHGLGIYSLLDYCGNSLYSNTLLNSRFDNFLQKLDTSTGNYIPLLGNASQIYGSFSLPNDVCTNEKYIIPNQSAITPSCQGSGCNGVRFAGNQFNIPVANPSTYSAGSSLSHFDGICANEHFVMRNSYTPFVGTFNRLYNPKEVTVLCDLGYQTSGIYGSSTLPFCYSTYTACGQRLAGVNDFYTYTSYQSGTPIQYQVNLGQTITINDFLNNDENVTGFTCPQILSENGSIISQTGSSLTIQSSMFSYDSFIIISYIPINSSISNRLGNTTYIFVKIHFPTYSSNAGNCNEICNGTFTPNAPSYSSSNPFKQNVPCWNELVGSPQLYPCYPNTTTKYYAKCFTRYRTNTQCVGDTGVNEGIKQGYHFLPTKKYILSFKRTRFNDNIWDLGKLDNFYVRLYNSTQVNCSNNFVQSGYNPIFNAPYQDLVYEKNITNTNWRHIIRYFKPNQAFDSLGFNIRTNANVLSGIAQTWLGIAEVEILKKEDTIHYTNCLPNTITPCLISGTDVAWKLNGNTIATTPNLLATVSGTYLFIQHFLADTVMNGSVYDTTIYIVNSVASFNLNAGRDTTVCYGSIVTVGTTALSGYHYKWTPKTNSINDTLANPTITVTTNTTYNLTVTSPLGCVKKDTIVITAKPQLIYTTNRSFYICKGDSVKIGGNPTVSGGAAPYVFSWSPTATLLNSSTANPIAICTATTAYHLTITDSNQCTSSIISDAIFVNPTPSVSVSGTSPVCQFSTNTLSVTPTSSNYSYQWKPTGNTTSSIAIPTSTAGTRNDTVIVTNTTTGCKTKIIKTTVINAKPIINITISKDSICQGSVATITASGASTYSWSPAIGLNTTSGNIVAASPLTTTTYIVAGTTNGCSSIKKDTITIMPLPSINATVLSSTICNADSVKLTATAGATSYQWTAPTGNTVRCSACAVTFTSLLNNATTSIITKTFTVVGKNGFGCQATDTVQIKIKPIPKDTISVTANDSICIGGSVTMTMKPITGNYAWIGTTNSTNTYTVSPTATTTFKVIGLINGCKTDTLKQKIIVLALPIVKDSSNKITICKGDTVRLSAKGASTYAWLPASVVCNAPCSKAYATPNITTTYHVTGTTTFGCSNTDSIVINIASSPKISLTPAIANYCNGTPVQFTTNVINGKAPFQYAWLPVTGLSSISTANPTASPISPTTYIVNVTDANGCKAKDTSIIGKNCCDSSYMMPTTISAFISNNNVPQHTITTMSAYPNIWGSIAHAGISNAILYVPANQTLTINQNFEFKNCTIYMGANAKIVVNDAKFLYVTHNTTIKACGNMWDGIYTNVTTQERISYYMDNGSLLMDAMNGFVSDNGARFYIMNSIFDRNYRSVQVRNYPLVHQGTINNSTIRNSYSNLKPPMQNSTSQMGIYICNVGYFRVGSTTMINNISDCKYGIYSMPTISGRYYSNYKTDIINNHFLNNQTGIYIRNVNCTIDANIISQSQYNNKGNIGGWNGNKGINIAGLGNAKQIADIKNNTLNTLNFGILTQLNNAGKIKITNNTINSQMQNTGTNTGLSCGIINDESGFGGLNNSVSYAVVNNHINNTNVGIYLRNLNAPFVNRNNPTYQNQYYNNDIHLNWNGVQSNTLNYGIYLQNNHNAFVQCNTIDCNINNGDYQFGTFDYGVYLTTNSNFNFIDGNSIQEITNGVQTEGRNKPNFLVANTLNSNAFGVVLHNNGEIGDQGFSTLPIRNLYGNKIHWGNMWTNLLPSAKTTFSYGGISNPFLSKIYVRRSESAPYYYSSTNTPAQSGTSLIFGYDNTTLPATNQISDASYPSLAGCEIPTPIYNPIKNQASMGEDVMRMAMDTTYNTEEEGMNDFFERMSLYNVLRQDAELTEDSILQHFRDMEQYLTIGKFYNVQTEIALAFDSSLYTYDTIYNEVTDSINNAIKHEHLNNAYNYLNDINPTLQAVQHFKTISMLTINYLRNDSLDATELQTAKDIAALCIYTYGAAVSNARALISIVEDSTITWNDNITCYGNFRSTDNDGEFTKLLAAINEEKIEKHENKITKQLVQVFPNPADKQINFSYTDIESNCTLKIYNYLGVAVYSKSISNLSGTISISADLFTNGLYVYQIISKDGDIKFNGKFNIEHLK